MVRFSFQWQGKRLRGNYKHGEAYATIDDGKQVRIVGWFRQAIIRDYPGADLFEVE